MYVRHLIRKEILLLYLDEFRETVQPQYLFNLMSGNIITISNKISYSNLISIQFRVFLN